MSNAIRRISYAILAYGLTFLGLVLLSIFGFSKVAIIGFASLIVWTIWKIRG